MAIKSKRCEVCGVEFTKKATCSEKVWANAKYCSRKCAHDGMLKVPREVVCAGCGKVFMRNTASGLTRSKYCSYACYQEHFDRQTKRNYNPARHSNELIECACGCGTMIAKYDYRGRLKKYVVGHTGTGKQRVFTPEWLDSLREAAIDRGKAHTGANHWNWKGGKTPAIHLLRHTPEYNAWRHAVYARDLWHCQECGKHCGRKDIVAHHIKSFKDYPELRYDVDNGITLCRKCHMKVERDKINAS